VLIREPKKRWGSADASGNLRFNWRIIQTPTRLIDYVIAHEQVHLAHRTTRATFGPPSAGRCRTMRCVGRRCGGSGARWYGDPCETWDREIQAVPEHRPGLTTTPKRRGYMRQRKTSTRSRREILKLGAMGAVVGAAAFHQPPAVAQTSARRTFVFVHGAWHGGWCWRRVADILETRGHKVYTPTLTGLGERSHLLTGSINLETHITDIVNVFKWEDLDNAVLCGHSYGGWVISGAIEQVRPHVSSIVYVDAYVPEDGQTVYDLTQEQNRPAIDETVRTRAISRPPQPAESYRVNPRDRAWVDGKTTPQPMGVYFQKIKLTGARELDDGRADVKWNFSH